MKTILKIISVVIAVYVITDAVKINVLSFESISIAKTKPHLIHPNIENISGVRFENAKTAVLVSR